MKLHDIIQFFLQQLIIQWDRPLLFVREQCELLIPLLDPFDDHIPICSPFDPGQQLELGRGDRQPGLFPFFKVHRVLWSLHSPSPSVPSVVLAE